MISLKKFSLIIGITVLAVFGLMTLGTVKAEETITSNSNNKDDATILDNINDLGIQPLYDACPSGGKHLMKPRGTGFVYIDGKRVINSGQTSQCSKCNTVIISTNNPFLAGTKKLGKYGNQGHSGPVENPTIMHTNKLYNNSSLRDMDGYTWTQ